MKTARLSVDRLRSLLDYDPETGAFRWRVSRGRVKAGTVAGTQHHSGYRQINLDGTLYLSHQLAWLHFYGVPQDRELDHINGDKADNRIVNLRLATHAQNAWNVVRRPGRSGYVGASPDGNRFAARIKCNGKKIHLGSFATAAQAHAAYRVAKRRLHGEFAHMSYDPMEVPMNAKPTTALTRMIGVERRALRRLKRGARPSLRERCWTALKSLTELQADPTRPGLAVQVAMNIVRARI